jgi:uncharacterized membrane protein
MGRKAKSRHRQQNENITQASLRSSPNWPLLAISIAGMVLTAYLTYTSWIGASVKGCSAGSGCDVVLTSRWATTFGLPTAFWGFLTYAGFAGIAFIKRADKHWRYAWTAALFGAAYSVYLTTVSLTILGATCPYCLTSLALMIGTLALVTYQRPADLKHFSWRPWLIRKISLAAVFVFALHLYQGIEPPLPDDPRAQALAEHLTAIGAKFYGASWCDHCQRQKKYFGHSATLLPFVECKPGGSSSPITIPCRDNAIVNFPTWIINDKRIEGVLTLSELADLSGFKPVQAGTN